MKQCWRAIAVAVTVVLALGLGNGPASGASLNLHKGSKGAQVRTLELRLYTLKLLPKKQVDRRYRVATVRAVKKFQRQQRMRVTGKVNLRTWNRVYAEVRRRATPPPKPRPAPLPPAPTILGHRGARVPGITENTLASMRYAAPRADILEFDLQLTADDEFVLMHDDTLQRTTNCTGPVLAQTTVQLRANCQTDNGSGPIPTFAEVVEFAAGAQKAIAPEVKDNSVTDLELTKLVTTINAYGLADRTFVQSFHPAVFPRLRALDSRLRFVHLMANPATPPADVTASGATIAGPNQAGLTAAQVAGFKRAGLKVWTWTAAKTEQLKALWGLRVDGVFTDIPDAARKMYHPG